ncbi:hypothetical protein [Bradyrhizobium sp. CCBAU 65884]|uniref:hypothetical protein n=1 Tax=Bradyrhizobium sp. CCBAU 65884 TaxID=722477 RepID=UPI002306B2EE|nr:hypothetical protein [Bradyrhizobium sp. CCBAU 65884]
MSFTAKIIRVLLASPSDLPQERAVVTEAIYDWNAQHSEAEAVVLLPIAWETHATPRSNVRPQQAINEQLVDKSDLLIGMFWTRLGTSTGVAESGTVEEIDRFVAAGKSALLYFSNRPIEPEAFDHKQNRRLKEFKETTNKNALTFTFNSLETLRQLINRALVAEVRSFQLRSSREAVGAPNVTAAYPPEPAIREDSEVSTPDETWVRQDYEREIFSAIRKHDGDRIKAIDAAYRKTEDYAVGDHSSSWEAYIEWARIYFGKGGQLKSLQKLASANPESAQTIFYLASAYAKFDRHGQAANSYLAATDVSKDSEQIARFASLAAEQFKKDNNEPGMTDALRRLRAVVRGEPDLEVVLLEAIQRLNASETPISFTIPLLERQIELTPDDHSIRFDLAYKQSEVGNKAIALHHYLKIPQGDRQPAAWNNIGATLDELEMPIKSVAAYKKAAAMNSTLAMSNLGNKLLKSGFLELAREQCAQARQDTDPHPNVGHLIASLASVEQKERLHQDEILKGIESRLAYLRQLGHAATLETPQDIAEEWQGPDCAFKLEQDGNKISLHGHYEAAVGGLLAALVTKPVGLGGLGAASATKTKHTIRYSGLVQGLAVIGKVNRGREGTTLLGSSDEGLAYMILSQNGDEIIVVENGNSDSPDVITLKRVLPPSDRC